MSQHCFLAIPTTEYRSLFGDVLHPGMCSGLPMSLGTKCNVFNFFNLKMSVIMFKYFIQVLFEESNYICHDLHELAKIFKCRSRNIH